MKIYKDFMGHPIKQKHNVEANESMMGVINFHETAIAEIERDLSLVRLKLDEEDLTHVEQIIEAFNYNKKLLEDTDSMLLVGPLLDNFHRLMEIAGKNPPPLEALKNPPQNS